MDTYKGLKMQLDSIQKKRLIFSEIFILQNKIQTRFDKLLGDITSKQFIVLVIVNSFQSPPSLTEVAKHAGCSRQNVKKIAAVLEKKGNIKLIPEKETRAVRIVLEQRFYDFIDEFSNKTEAGLEDLFYGMKEAEMEDLFAALHRVEENVDRIIKDEL